MFRSESHKHSEEVRYLAQVQCKEDRLKIIFGPLEKYFCVLESILTWEYPVVFLLLFVFVNCLFWVYSITPFYCLISIGGFLVLNTQFMVNHILPLFKDSDASEEWVKIKANENDDNLDIFHCWAVMMTMFENGYKILEFHKRDNRDRFNLLGILIYLLLLMISFVVNESYLLYFIVTGVLIWPGLKYNKINEKIFNLLKPYLHRFERKMRIKRTISIKDINLDDDSDVELEQFIPVKDENTEYFPSLVSENVDDSDTNEDFMPHGGDSKEGTDDEFLSEELSLTSHYTKAALKLENLENMPSESETESNEGNARNSHFPDDKDIKDELNFVEGLSFNDDGAVDNDGDNEGDEENNSKETKELQSMVKSNQGFMAKTLVGLASMYKMVNSYIPSSIHPLMKKKEDKVLFESVQTVDDEFDFLNHELEDIN